MSIYMQRLPNVSYKGHITIFSVVGHGVSVMITQLSHCAVGAAVDSKQMNECAWVPVKFYLQKQAAVNLNYGL